MLEKYIFFPVLSIVFLLQEVYITFNLTKQQGYTIMRVCVIGAGVAGVCAALQVSRSGVDCLLIEKNALSGGTLSAGGIACPGLFHAWGGRQVISGIGWELVKETVELSGASMPDFSAFDMNYFWHYQVPVNSFIFSSLCDEKFNECKVDVRYHTMLAQLQPDGDAWLVSLCGRDGIYTEKVDFVIDCTGDANAVKMAGFPVSEPEICQPGTYSVHCSGYDLDSVDWDALRSSFNDACARKEVLPEDIGWLKGFARLFLVRNGENANHIRCRNVPHFRSMMEISGRQSVMRMYRFLKKQPGFEKLDIRFSGMECGVRESRTIIGEATVTEEEFLAGKIYPDAVCYGFYPVDLHDDEAGVIKRLLPEGVVPTVPRGALIPAGSSNMLAAGRIISSDRMANSGLRIQATCMATGQASGALAALCVRHSAHPLELPNDLLRNELAKHGAILPPV